MAERRGYIRVPFFTKVVVLPQAATASVESAHSIDISLGGVGLVCQSALPIGQPVSLTFYLPTATGEVPQGPVPGRVTGVRFENNTSILGVEFDHTLERRLVPELVRAVERL